MPTQSASDTRCSDKPSPGVGGHRLRSAQPRIHNHLHFYPPFGAPFFMKYCAARRERRAPRSIAASCRESNGISTPPRSLHPRRVRRRRIFGQSVSERRPKREGMKDGLETQATQRTLISASRPALRSGRLNGNANCRASRAAASTTGQSQPGQASRSQDAAGPHLHGAPGL